VSSCSSSDGDYERRQSTRSRFRPTRSSSAPLRILGRFTFFDSTDLSKSYINYLLFYMKIDQFIIFLSLELKMIRLGWDILAVCFNRPLVIFIRKLQRNERLPLPLYLSYLSNIAIVALLLSKLIYNY
jgi:hypothetical protein